MRELPYEQRVTRNGECEPCRKDVIKDKREGGVENRDDDKQKKQTSCQENRQHEWSLCVVPGFIHHPYYSPEDSFLKMYVRKRSESIWCFIFNRIGIKYIYRNYY